MSIASQRTTHTHKEAGMVAIMVTLILMIVISLIVLGFAQVARRNQRQSLDRQLSTQAFYAAETGINDTANLIKTTAATGGTIVAKTSCTDTGGGFYSSLPSANIDMANDVAYTCLTVDPTPTALVYSDVGTTGIVVPMTSANGTPIRSIRLVWQSKLDASNPAANCPTTATNVFVPTANWTCGYGVLRFDLVPTSDPALDNAKLLSRGMVSFLVPKQTGGPANIPYATNGSSDLRTVSCSATDCTATITGLNDTQYYMHITSLYRNVSLQITALDSSGNPLEIADSQAVVDATGKAQDVLRRIQVHLPLRGTSVNLTSDFALQSTESVCKRFAVMDGFGGAPGFFQSSAGLGGPNPLCQ